MATEKTPADGKKSKPRMTRKEQMDRLVQDLRTHHIELDLQNEELRLAYAELEASRNRYSDLYNLAPVAYISLDAKGVIREANFKASELLAWSRSRLLNQPLLLCVEKDSRQLFLRHLAEVIGKGGSHECEIRMKKRDGLPFRALLQSVGLKDSLLHISCRMVITDITERVRADEEIRELNETLRGRTIELEEANKELSSFIYSVSHDLRGPLRSMAAFAKLIDRQYADCLDERGQDYLRRVLGACTRMDRIIEDLLHLSRVSQRKLERSQVDLSALAASYAAEQQAAAPNRSVAVHIQEGLTTNADPQLCEVALANLMGNAWKFTAHKEKAAIFFGARRQHGQTIYYLRDNGIGFDPALAAKMFQPFQRLHSEEEFEGTGIGLAIVEQAIHRHGGRIWAEGKEGKGATFYFTLE